MHANDPIDSYLHELRRELRVSRWARRRIVLEARAHLQEAVEAERTHGLKQDEAIERALARFGVAGETARQFDGISSKHAVLLRRTLVPWVAAVAVTSMASATVWAFQPGSSAARAGAHAAAAHAPAARTRVHDGAAADAHGSARGRRLAHTIPRQPAGRARAR
jgi:hypothetical protein